MWHLKKSNLFSFKITQIILKKNTALIFTYEFQCNLPDVAQWYRAWYKCFCPEIKNSSTIRDRLSSALQTMNTLCNEVETRMPSEAPPYLPPPPPPPCNISDEEMDFSQEPEHQEPPRYKPNDFLETMSNFILNFERLMINYFR
jgi:hypothetical protein